MGRRLQVLMDDAEWRELQKLARKQGMTVSQWVRQAIAMARDRLPIADPGPKLAAVREAAGHAYPSGDIDQILAEIERGYLSDAEVAARKVAEGVSGPGR